MKQRFLSVLGISITVIAALLCTQGISSASFQLYDGKLELSGYVKNTTYIRTQMYERDEPYHDSKIDFSRNAALLEALYNFRQTDTYSLRFFGSIKGWYEMASQFDDQLRKTIPEKLRKGYRNPRSFDDDILTELYVDYINGPWNIRVGKQIITWGELDVDRAADVINPIDLRWGVPGIDAWEEVKMGLWVIRGTYQSQLPGSLLFETVINPGHFRSPLPAAYSGTHWGADQFKDNAFTKYGPGVFGYLESRWLHEDKEQRYSMKNWELGFRVRGFTYNVDWTLLWYNAPADQPIFNANAASDYTTGYIMTALKSMMLGKDTISWHDLPDPTDYPHQVFEWKRYQIFGATAQTTFNNFMPSAVWRTEIAYGRHEPFALSTDQTTTNIYGHDREDTLATALSWSDKWTIPWVTRHICTGKQMETTLTYYRQTILNRNHDAVTKDYYIDKSDTFNEKVSLFMQLYMFNYSWVFTFTGFYQTKSDRWMACPCLSYIFPGEHWRIDAGWKGYGAKAGKDRKQYLRGSYYDKDSIIFRLRYEF